MHSTTTFGFYSFMVNNSLIGMSVQTGAVTAVAVSDDGSLVVSGGEDRCVVIWEPSSES
jgi:WD40 repeat protein